MNRLFWLKLFMALSSLTFVCGSAMADGLQSDENLVTWRKLADKISLGVIKLPGGFFPGEVTLLKTKLKDFQPRVVRAKEYERKRSTVKWLAEKARAPICINANFFDPDGNPLGLVVSRGVKYHNTHHGGSTLTGTFLAFSDRALITHRSTVGAEYGLEAVQAGPRLVANGAPLQGVGNEKNFSRRSGLCLTQSQELILFAVTSALRGASLSEMSRALVNPAVKCQDALNFDGGGSSQLYVSQEVDGAAPEFKGIELAGRDDIPVALCLFPRNQ